MTDDQDRVTPGAEGASAEGSSAEGSSAEAASEQPLTPGAPPAGDEPTAPNAPPTAAAAATPPSTGPRAAWRAINPAARGAITALAAVLALVGAGFVGAAIDDDAPRRAHAGRGFPAPHPFFDRGMPRDRRPDSRPHMRPRDTARPMLGVRGVPDDNGFRVIAVMPNSPASEAGIEPFDVITHVNGAAVRTARDIAASVEDGGSARLRLLRDGDERTVAVELGEPRETSATF